MQEIHPIVGGIFQSRAKRQKDWLIDWLRCPLPSADEKQAPADGPADTLLHILLPKLLNLLLALQAALQPTSTKAHCFHAVCEWSAIHVIHTSSDLCCNVVGEGILVLEGAHCQTADTAEG